MPGMHCEHRPGLSSEAMLQVEPRLLTWEHRAPIILEQLLEADADVVCLQEVNHFGGSQCAGSWSQSSHQSWYGSFSATSLHFCMWQAHWCSVSRASEC